MQNELSILDFIHLVVETYDSYFEGVTELDVSKLPSSPFPRVLQSTSPRARARPCYLVGVLGPLLMDDSYYRIRV